MLTYILKKIYNLKEYIYTGRMVSTNWPSYTVRNVEDTYTDLVSDLTYSRIKVFFVEDILAYMNTR